MSSPTRVYALSGGSRSSGCLVRIHMRGRVVIMISLHLQALEPRRPAETPQKAHRRLCTTARPDHSAQRIEGMAGAFATSASRSAWQSFGAQ
jgi:hypothetical protein